MLLCAPAFAAEAPLVPFTVCEVMLNLPAYAGKSVAVLGRYSFRKTGRYISQEACGPEGKARRMDLVEDPATAPRPADEYTVDGPSLDRKVADLRSRTALGKFRFGTPEYDRWTVIFGRIEKREATPDKEAGIDLIFRGSGAIIFLTPD